MNRLVLFDIDRTLLKSSSAHRKAFAVAFLKIYGIDTDIEVIRVSGMTDQQIIYGVLEKNGLNKEEIESKIGQCMDEMIAAFTEFIADEELIVLRGVKELLESLEGKNVLMGLVTGNLEPIARGKINKVGLNNFFKVGGFGSEHIDRAELVKIAIKKAQTNYGFEFGNNIYLFGDAPQDMRAAKEAKIIPIGVTTGIYTKEQLEDAGASIVFKDLIDTKGILNYLGI